jgi:GNAT superfamily N-acetyltransferase
MTSHRIVTDEKNISWHEVATLFAAVSWKGRSAADLQTAFANSRFKAFAFVGDELVGLGRTIDDGKFYATVVDVVVSPAHQGVGVGRAIVQSLQERLNEFLLVTLTAAPPVQAFYETLGWRTMATGMMLPRSPEQAQDNSGTLVAFAVAAEQFCAWVESPPAEPADELLTARRFAARLYAAALELPADNAGPVAEELPEPEVDRRAVCQRFGVLPINLYSAVDPLVLPANQPTVGDLADDLTDTYVDVLRGLAAFRAGSKDAAAWEWAFSFRTHWGSHLVSALSALHTLIVKS